MGDRPTADYVELVDGIASYGVPQENISSLLGYINTIYGSELDNRYEELTFYIGVYIALASLVCILSMVADLLHGLRSRKLWFPCKYFRINAAFLSVIGVAMKLHVDLSGSTPGDVDQMEKLGSMAFLCTSMANLLPCLATMDSNELLTNITALCISVVVHVCIQIQSNVVSYSDYIMLQLDSVDIRNNRHTTLAFIYVALLLVLLITACFLMTSASGVICVLLAFLHTLTIYWSFKLVLTKDTDSEYSWSVIVILLVQFIGVVIGTIAPLSRCFVILNFKVSSKMVSNHFKVFKVESYWTGMLYDWKRASIELPIRRHSIKCNLLREHWKAEFSRLEPNVYVLHLEDEMELADRTLKGFSKSVNQLILKGKKNKPNNLIKLIEEKSSSDFHGVGKFDQIDHYHVPSLLSKGQYRECWSLPVVILTTIAVSFPKVEKKDVKSLLEGVREGLLYVKLVEESLNVTDNPVSVPNEAHILWKEVEVDHEWLGHKLQDPSFQAKTARQIVEWFWDTSENIDHNGRRIEDSIHMSICANSMYGITKTILHAYHTNGEDKVSQKELFDNLSSMIADIIAACLTNLPKVIALKCHTKVIEKRVAIVEDAAQLLGETEQIIKTLQCRRIPDMNPRDLPFIDKWRAYMESRIP
ncbi:hypothetical protein L1987_80380 [Smallanthus sonchifolius]|uniref:Uncharacterized protein n=1 Tax=Smallanthus sonchifolius TaxID=185202 RepID=A0ACB8YNL9_9ASTR|nr:hypothetical protein L1987_80380 [Smallanthus sonchifolius]